MGFFDSGKTEWHQVLKSGGDRWRWNEEFERIHVATERR